MMVNQLSLCLSGPLAAADVMATPEIRNLGMTIPLKDNKNAKHSNRRAFTDLWDIHSLIFGIFLDFLDFYISLL